METSICFAVRTAQSGARRPVRDLCTRRVEALSHLANPRDDEMHQPFVVPVGEGKTYEAAQMLEQWLRLCKPVTVLSGAGMSTASGIPDYRSPTGAYSKGHKPMTHQEFMGREMSRRRYWARSILGYKKFEATKPNKGHAALVRLQNKGFVERIVTQNVDGLHGLAGSTSVIELHGRGRVVKCQSCNHEWDRGVYRNATIEANKEWLAKAQADGKAEIRPDGDADVEFDVSNFVIPPCINCGKGIVKPDVVFFGDNVHPAVKAWAHYNVRNTGGLLAIGSTVQAYSAFSLVLTAAQHYVPIAVLNIGETRVDTHGLKVLRLSERVEDVLAMTSDLIK